MCTELRLDWTPSESSRGKRNRRCLVGTTRRKTGHCVLFWEQRLLSAYRIQALDAVPLSGTCGGQRGRSGSPGGTARRGNKALRSQNPTFTPGGTLGLCPTEPALIAAAPAAAGPGGERPGKGGTGVEGNGGREGERRGGGRRPALAAGSGGGSR